MKNNLLLGSHISIEGGLEKALERGNQIDCTAIQIFTTSSRQWNKKKLTQEEIDIFKTTQKETAIQVVAHCSYLINIASEKSDVRKKSIISLTEEIIRCNTLGIKYAVLHPGSRLNASIEDAIAWAAEGLDEVLKQTDESTMILLETMAGQGSTIGSTFEELAQIRSLAKHKNKIGICADTCHLFSSGYDFTTESGYKDMWHNFDKKIGLSHLKVLHMNDSKKECGSKVDRHEEIGQGLIGKHAFGFIMNDPKLASVMKILETPKATLEDDKKNMEILKRLIK